MITIVSLFVIAAVFRNVCTQKNLGDFMSPTNMDALMRRTALEQHNWKRYFLAGGYPFPHKQHVKYPTASDMNVLYYDIDLEDLAYEIASECNVGTPNFNYVGSNNGTSKVDDFNSDYISKIIDDWWETALKGGNLVNLTPSQENTPKIPFLQMANAKTNRLGCAFEICDDQFNREYVLFVCKYGTETVRIGNPIYTRGPPCGSCRNKCTFNKRLCAS